MESLDSVGNILRHKNRHDLANLLSRAFLDFEYVDIGILVENIDADVEIVDAAIRSLHRLRTPEDSVTRRLRAGSRLSEGDLALSRRLFRQGDTRCRVPG